MQITTVTHHKEYHQALIRTSDDSCVLVYSDLEGRLTVDVTSLEQSHAVYVDGKLVAEKIAKKTYEVTRTRTHTLTVAASSEEEAKSIASLADHIIHNGVATVEWRASQK